MLSNKDLKFLGFEAGLWLRKLHPGNLDADAIEESERVLANRDMADGLHWLSLMSIPPLRFLHAENALSQSKLGVFRRKSTSDLISWFATPGHSRET